MIRVHRFLAVGAAAVILFGCSTKTDDQMFADAVEAQKGESFDKALELYQDVVTEHPASPRVPEALYAMGGIYQDRTKQFDKAIATYRRLTDGYPTHATASNALFMMGFLYHNELKNLDSARSVYSDFLRRYPDSPLSTSAKFELETLGKTPDEVLAEQAKPAKRSKGR